MSSLPVGTDHRFPLRLHEDPSGPAQSAMPLNDMQMAQLHQSVRLAHPIRKAGRYASFNGWMTLLAGCLTVPFAIGDLPTLAFAVLLGAIGTHELTLRRRLLRFALGTTRKLAINQVFLAVTLSAYAIFKMIQSATTQGMISSALANDPAIQSTPEIAEMLGGFSQIEKLATVGLYVLLLVIALLVQGSSIIYYCIKGKSLTRFHAKTPTWAIQIHRAMQGETQQSPRV